MRRALPWIGLLLLAISFVWLIHLPPPSDRVTAPRFHPRPHPERPLLVVLDPGHGGDDSGAMCGEVMEKDLALDVAHRAELLMRAAGFGTRLTRESDRYVSLAERASLGNQNENSLFISIHFNDGKQAATSGVETYYSPMQSNRPTLLSWLPFLRQTDSGQLTAKSETLASCLQGALIRRTRALDRGIKTEPFYVIANLRQPAALIEGGFLTNKSDLNKLATPEYRQQLAAAICEGVTRYRAALEQGGVTFALAAPRPE